VRRWLTPVCLGLTSANMTPSVFLSVRATGECVSSSGKWGMGEHRIGQNFTGKTTLHAWNGQPVVVVSSSLPSSI